MAPYMGATLGDTCHDQRISFVNRLMSASPLENGKEICMQQCALID